MLHSSRTLAAGLADCRPRRIENGPIGPEGRRFNDGFQCANDRIMAASEDRGYGAFRWVGWLTFLPLLSLLDFDELGNTG